MKMLRIIWAAMLGGTIVYTGVIYALLRAGVIDIASLAQSIMNYAGVAVLIYMIAGVFARRAMVARISMDAPEEKRLAAYQTATIVGLAMSEGGGLILITMGMMAGASSWVLTGGGAAAFLMLMARPTGEEVGLD